MESEHLLSKKRRHYSDFLHETISEEHMLQTFHYEDDEAIDKPPASPRFRSQSVFDIGKKPLLPSISNLDACLARNESSDPLSNYESLPKYYRRSNRHLGRLNTQLLNAVKACKPLEVEKLLDTGANPNATCHTEYISACHIAALCNNNILSLLLQHGAERQRTDRLGRTPLHLAAWAGNVRHVAALLDFPEGQTWPSPDPCKNYTCSRDVTGRLTHTEKVENCVTECKRGWGYRPPAAGVCCGICVQDKCIIGDELKEPGASWQSADNCTQFSCERAGDQVFVTSARETCRDVSRCAPEDIVQEGCCKVCKETPDNLSVCAPRSIPSKSTIGLFHQRIGDVVCVNREPVKGFTECKGTCDSAALYNNVTGRHDTECECCTVARYSTLQVTLQCSDGSLRAHRAAAPARCACAACGEHNNWTKNAHFGTKNPTPRPRPSRYEEAPDNDAVPEIFQRFGEIEDEAPSLT